MEKVTVKRLQELLISLIEQKVINEDDVLMISCYETLCTIDEDHYKKVQIDINDNLEVS